MRTWAITRVLRDRNAGLYLSAVVVSGFGDRVAAGPLLRRLRAVP
ncbi:hypothetical protein ACIP79_29405 [Streptomyces sp. NPDC088747]